MRTFDTRFGGLDAMLDSPITAARIDAYPRRLFTADLLQIGKTYRHPKDGWELKVTLELAEKIVSSAKRMLANGVEVPVLARHSFDGEPPIEDVLGYVKGAFIEDGWLRAKLQFRGADAIEAGQRIDRVSIGLLPELVDGEGRAYFHAIQHIALTPYPVVDDQRGLVPIAASRGGVFNHDSGNQEVLTMALDDEFAGPLGNNAAEVNKRIGIIAEKLHLGEFRGGDDLGTAVKMLGQIESRLSMALERGREQANELEQLRTGGEVAPAVAASLVGGDDDDYDAGINAQMQADAYGTDHDDDAADNGPPPGVDADMWAMINAY